MKTINFFTIFIIEYFIINSSENKILFVFEHFRHGARSPSDLFEDDLDLVGEKWYGTQELSYVGIRQSYLLGHFIRNKYPDLINYKKYNPKEIEVLSTMTNRTIMSARAHVNGIFNNTEKNQIDDNQINLSIPYYLSSEIDEININNTSLYPDNFPEEVPVHIIDYNEKLIQLEKNSICPAIKDMREENKKRQEFKDFIQEFNSTFGEQLLKIYNNKDSNYYMDYENVNDICISIIINKFDDREFKFFNDKIDLELFYKMALKFFGLKTNLVYSNNINGTLGYVGSSIFIRKILSYMENIINDLENGDNKTPKLVAFASHDTAIANMEGILDNLFDIEPIPPTYSSSYIFELTKNEDSNEYFVNLVLNNETLKTIEYNMFKNKIISDSWTYEETGKYCGFLKEEDKKPKNDKNISKKTWVIIIIIFGLLNAIFIGLIIYLLLSKKSFQDIPEIIEGQNKIDIKKS